MPKMIDVQNQRFGRLVALEWLGTATGWMCRCDCGNKHHVPSDDLRRGKSKSCGCLNRELTAARSTTHGQTAGRLRWSPEYHSWRSAKARTTNPGRHDWKNYGGRGISMCAEWRGREGFARFLAEVGPRPSPLHSIDRINNDGNYEPGNVRWATRFEQARNTRSQNNRGNRE